jgi:predicted NUDIX family phosphoesterase
MNHDEKTKKDNIKKLEHLASEVYSLKQAIGLRRPLLIEFCGSPKAGKTTSITSLNIFLKRNGFKTRVLTERASVCPVDSKTHPFFNSWTLCAAMAEIVEHLSTRDRFDIIIADRGIFDALCWFEWLNTNPPENPYLDDKSYKAIQTFVLMDMWTHYLDLIYVFKSSPNISLDREFANLLTEEYGSIMNPKVLDGFNRSIDSAVQKFQGNFRIVQQMETSDISPSDLGYNVTHQILSILKDALIEKIGFFNLSEQLKLKPGINDFSVIENHELAFGNREEVEKSNNIQPIAIAVITNRERDKVLVVRKNPQKAKDSPEANKLLLYVGGHIRKEDSRGNTLLENLKIALHREIEEEIGESVDTFKLAKPFLIYKSDNIKSRKHLGVCFVISMDFEDKRFKLTSDEFIRKSGKSRSGDIIEVRELIRLDEEFEEWSQIIFSHVFHVEGNKQTNLDMFVSP